MTLRWLPVAHRRSSLSWGNALQAIKAPLSQLPPRNHEHERKKLTGTNRATISDDTTTNGRTTSLVTAITKTVLEVGLGAQACIVVGRAAKRTGFGGKHVLDALELGGDVSWISECGGR
jgi:hypothetical protein